MYGSLESLQIGTSPGMNLGGKSLAQTGVALARFCANRGARVTVTDAKAPPPSAKARPPPQTDMF
jgi:UDP-N-acetylmuramoylalanine-D-glutamate ligase